MSAFNFAFSLTTEVSALRWDAVGCGGLTVKNKARFDDDAAILNAHTHAHTKNGKLLRENMKIKIYIYTHVRLLAHIHTYAVSATCINSLYVTLRLLQLFVTITAAFVVFGGANGVFLLFIVFFSPF